MGSTGNHKRSIPVDILDDLCSRFIINLPAEDRDDLVRICFQIELAHWFYLDYYVTDESTNLSPVGIREFAAHIFRHVPHLRAHTSSLDCVLTKWREYKSTVPTYGAILLDQDLTHVLLVQSYWTKASWGFPKGKVNEDEEPWKCAVREVLEETGFDISKLINKNDYIEATIHEQIVRLYIIGYIPRDTVFQPRTRNEIKACEWFPLTDLPNNKKDMTPKMKMGVSPNAFFMVLPFVKRMRRWVIERNPKAFRRTRHKSMGEIEVTASCNKNKNKTISQGLQNEITDYQTQYKNHGHNLSYGNSGNHNQSYGNNGNHNQSYGNNANQNQGYGNNAGSSSSHNQSYGNNGNQTQSYGNNGNQNQSYGNNGNHNQSYGNNGNQNQHGNSSGNHSATKSNQSAKKERKHTKRQLFTPQNTQTNNVSPIATVSSTNVADDAYFNFVAPSWANFKFDRRAILDCLT